MQILVLGLVFGSLFVIIGHAGKLLPMAYKGFIEWRLRQIEQQKRSLKENMLFVDPKKVATFNLICPIVSILIFALVGLKFGSVIVGGLIGLAIGFLIPSIVLKNMILGRKNKFNSQISDGLMILSSCLKGGLSLLQAIEAVSEELPPPINQEFGLILRENKMGMSLEESFAKLNKRLPSEELNLLTTAILVSRETGGDITQLFTTLINTIRAKLKLVDSVKTLSMQGKIQGIVMSILPIGFTIMVYSFNPHYFDIMLSNPVGRILLIYAVISEVVGIFLIKIFSRVAI
ncbi:MAG: type II secretion system F family protein [Candidatus Omnitrophota bacterium]